jgi:hypothetical protein
MTDEEYNLFSMNPDLQDSPSNKTGFRLYSDYFTIKYSHLRLDEIGMLHPKPSTVCTNFTELRELLLSKDLSRV